MKSRWLLVAVTATGAVTLTPWIMERFDAIECDRMGGRWSGEEALCLELQSLPHPEAVGGLSPELQATCTRTELGDEIPLPGYWPSNAFRQSTSDLRRMMPRDTRNLDSLSVEMARFHQGWYAIQLCAMGELPLGAPERHGVRVRLLWLRSFHPGVAVRVEHNRGGTRLTVIELDGAGGYAPGHVARRQEVALGGGEWGQLQELLDRDGFWRSKSAIPSGGVDGARWIIEVSEASRYHVVDRWGDSKVGEYLLSISGLTFEPIY